MDYMTEIAEAALGPLCCDAALRPDSDMLTEHVESALKIEMGWSRFLDIWRDGSPDARRDLLADLLYRRPDIALLLVRTVLDNRYPNLLIQLARRISNSGPDSAVGVYRNLPEDELMTTLLSSPERVLMLAEFFSIPVPLSTAEHVLWCAAQNAGESDTSRLTYLMSRLARLKEQLELVGHTVEHSTDKTPLSERAGYRSAVDREVERTEASIERLEQLLACLRGNAPKPRRARRAGFMLPCRPRRMSRLQM
jgi:hypothetical protein